MKENNKIITIFTIITIKNMSKISKILEVNKISGEELNRMFEELPNSSKNLIKEINVQSYIKKLEPDEVIEFLDISYNKILSENLDSFRLLRIFLFVFGWSQYINNEIYSTCLLDLTGIKNNNLKELLFFIDKKYNLKEFLFLLYLMDSIEKINIVSFNDGAFRYEQLIKDVEEIAKNFSGFSKISNRMIEIKSCELRFDSLFQYADYVNNEVENSYTVVIGIEKLLEFKNKQNITVKFPDGQMNFYQQDNMNWEELTNNLNIFFNKFNGTSNGVTCTFEYNYVNKVGIEEVSRLAEELNSFDIIHNNFYNQKDIVSSKLVNNLGKISTKEHIGMIEENKNNIDEENKSLLYAYLHLYNNDYLKAIEILEELPRDTDCNYMGLLAQLYLKMNNRSKSLQIYKDIHNKDRLNVDIINNILHSLDKDINSYDEIYAWLKKALKINSKDIRILIHLGNYHAKNKSYKKSSSVWKYILNLTGDKYYDFLYDLNMFLVDFEHKSIEEVVQWTNRKVYEHPKYKNIIYYELGELTYYEKKSKYRDLALDYFNSVDMVMDEDISYRTSIKKMEIYYWKYFREKYKYIGRSNAYKFLKNLIDNIPVLTYGSKSTYKWSKYLYRTLSIPYDVWLEFSQEILFDYLAEWEDFIINENNQCTVLEVNYIDNNFIETEHGFMPDLSSMSIDNYLTLLLATAQVEVSKGNIQIANDIAYDFFNLANNLEGKYKKIAISFGLLTWSNNCFAINSYIEGILSFIAAIEVGIEVNEYFLAINIFMNNILEYLYSISDEIKLNDEKKELLKKYFKLTNAPETLYYSIIGKYDDVLKNEIKEIKEFVKIVERNDIKIIINFKLDSKEHLLHIDNLIQAFYKKDMVSESIKYINIFKDTLLLNTSENLDISSNYFVKWSDILYEVKEYKLALELLIYASENLIELRKVSHKEERAFFGERLKIVNEKILKILYYMENGKRDFTKDERFISCIINLLPKSIIEQKNQNFNMKMSGDMKDYEEKYWHLNNIIKNTNYKEPNNPIYKENIKQFLKTKEYLEKNHSGFKPLPIYNLSAEKFFQTVQDRLLNHDIFYQTILVDEILIHICITKDSQSIEVDKINVEQLNHLLDQLCIEIKKDVLTIENSKPEEYIKIFDRISDFLFKPLLKIVNKNDTLYYMPDFNLKYITPNYLRIADKWLIENINNIELVIDYYDIERSKKSSNDLGYAYFSSESKKGSLDIIRDNLESRDYFDNILIKEDTLKILKPLKTLVIVAHGVNYLFRYNYQGALNLELSREKQIDLKEVLVANENIENIIVIACSGGTPIDNKIERNNGVWASLFEKNVNNILLCKWDVSTEYTNNILSILLDSMNESNISLSEALKNAQLKYIDKNPILWAGLEVWKNQ